MKNLKSGIKKVLIGYGLIALYVGVLWGSLELAHYFFGEAFLVAWFLCALSTFFAYEIGNSWLKKNKKK